MLHSRRHAASPEVPRGARLFPYTCGAIAPLCEYAPVSCAGQGRVPAQTARPPAPARVRPAAMLRGAISIAWTRAALSVQRRFGAGCGWDRTARVPFPDASPSGSEGPDRRPRRGETGYLRALSVGPAAGLRPPGHGAGPTGGLRHAPRVGPHRGRPVRLRRPKPRAARVSARVPSGRVPKPPWRARWRRPAAGTTVYSRIGG